MNTPIGRLSLPEGLWARGSSTGSSFDTSRYAMKWDGKWHITIEVFRDLGLAFAALRLLIYAGVGWFQLFKTPLLITAAIPFSLLGTVRVGRGGLTRLCCRKLAVRQGFEPWVQV